MKKTKYKELRPIYEQLVPKYARLIQLGVDKIGSKLAESRTEFSNIVTRVKSFDSFVEKIGRKGCSDPFAEIDDIAGIRIICFYPSDLHLIEKSLSELFLIDHSKDKTGNLDPDRFGYRSHHYTVRFRPAFLEGENIEELKDLKIEIQLRTLLMHVWADIQGKLEYKREEDSPRLFRRKLFQLSALLELADEQFQLLKEEKATLRLDLEKGKELFTDETEFSIDSFFAFMEVYFHKRKFSYRYTKTLFLELSTLGIPFSAVIDAVKSVESRLNTIELDLTGEKGKWTRVKTLRTALELTNDRYWQNKPAAYRRTPWGRAIRKWRNFIREVNASS